MSKKSRLPQSSRHVNIYDEDWNFLQATFGKESAKPLGASVVICEIIHKNILRLKQDLADRLDTSSSQQEEN